jgi:hypothetical protein
LTHLKIKLNGDNLQWDVDRVVAVNRVAEETQGKLGVSTWYYSCDFNERCANVEYLLDFLAKVKELAPTALGRLQYIEQPTHRDLKAHPENRMHRAASIKPVVIDESLIDLESFHLAREQGYSGVALKACKGHTEALLMGAAAQKYKMFLCVQDLSCPAIDLPRDEEGNELLRDLPKINVTAHEEVFMAPIGIAERVRIVLENVDFSRQTFFTQSFLSCRQTSFEQSLTGFIVDDEIKNVVALGGRVLRMAACVLIKPSPVYQKRVGGPTVRNKTFKNIPQHLFHRKIHPSVWREDETVLILQTEDPPF